MSVDQATSGGILRNNTGAPVTTKEPAQAKGSSRIKINDQPGNVIPKPDTHSQPSTINGETSLSGRKKEHLSSASKNLGETPSNEQPKTGKDERTSASQNSSKASKHEPTISKELKELNKRYGTTHNESTGENNLFELLTLCKNDKKQKVRFVFATYSENPLTSKNTLALDAIKEKANHINDRPVAVLEVKGTTTQFWVALLLSSKSIPPEKSDSLLPSFLKDFKDYIKTEKDSIKLIKTFQPDSPQSQSLKKPVPTDKPSATHPSKKATPDNKEDTPSVRKKSPPETKSGSTESTTKGETLTSRHKESPQPTKRTKTKTSHGEIKKFTEQSGSVSKHQTDQPSRKQPNLQSQLDKRDTVVKQLYQSLPTANESTKQFAMQLDKTQTATNQLTASNISLTAKKDSLKNLLDKKTKEHTEVQSALSNLKTSHDLISGSLRHVTSDHQDLQKQLNTKNTEAKQLSTELKTADTSLKELTASYNSLNKQLTQETEKNTKSQSDGLELKQQKTELETQIKELTNKQQVLQKQLEKNNEASTLVNTKNEKLMSETKSLNVQLTQVREQLTQETEKNTKSQSDGLELKQQKAELETQIKELTNKQQDLQKQLEKKTTEAEQFSTQLEDSMGTLTQRQVEEKNAESGSSDSDGGSSVYMEPEPGSGSEI